MTRDAGAAAPRRSTRGRWTAAVVLLAAAVGACAAAPWVTATGASPLGDVTLRAAGSAAAPAVPATALVLAAAGAAIPLAGRVGRWLVALVVALGGLAVAASAVAVVVDPAGVAAQAAASRTGVDHLVGTPDVTAAPWVAALVGAVAVALAAGLVRASARWPVASRRYEGAPGRPVAPPRADDEPDRQSDWDALTRGTDPSDA